ncbi:FCD domain-containing protein [Vibrio aestuarianus]|jgi:GntR family uxuAB operon transcriptional repressor|uniref:FCD domain-containing protein n=1 Tax=Vibrio aestuarianus TaxID=28171 RepID=A0AAX3U3G5_9VIBR|nr:FCD domain-containing protein [Vibrio aestuarianus]MDE1339961.1 FCD domain-containing protein [Vibrio aestuarianus]WGK81776.1 FCD domain-containing protein [Vibrio aestuarianus]
MLLENKVAQNSRRYVSIGLDLLKQLERSSYAIGERLPTEREIAEQYNVSRTVIREAIIMLELEGLVEVRKGSGVYVVALPNQNTPSSENVNNATALATLLETTDIGPFEMLQGRQLIESNVAEFAATQITKSEILEMRAVLNAERHAIKTGDSSEDYDKEFHLLIAKATKNTFLIEISELMWAKRAESKMWAQLHSHINGSDYRLNWLDDHAKILASLQRKDPAAAKMAMWEHLESVKNTLLELSDVEDDSFDGYLFDSYPIVNTKA